MADNFSVVLSGLYFDSDIPFALYIADVAVNVVFSAAAVLGNTHNGCASEIVPFANPLGA